jgi:oligopeptide transport system substrate-binding protein
MTTGPPERGLTAGKGFWYQRHSMNAKPRSGGPAGKRAERVRTATLPVLAVVLLVAGSWPGCSNDPYPTPPAGRKVIYAALGEDPHGLDPVQTGDTLSGHVVSQLYDALYEYHYLKRPYELKPALAEAMPEVSEDRLTYTISVKQGVRFQDDGCFPGGRGREVTAHDFVYSIKRLADQANEPRGWWLLQGKIAGLDEFHEESVARAAEPEGKRTPMDYSWNVPGLQAADDYTLQIQLVEPFPQLKYALAMSYTAAVPHEAVEKYGDEFHNHPVGTGPFRLKEWSKRWRLILERNPTFRDDFYPSEGEPGDREAGLLEAAGTRLPVVDEVHYTIVYEDQPAWLYFKQGYVDASGISKDHFAEVVTEARELSPEFLRKGVSLTKLLEAQVGYIGFNMNDPVVGGDRRLRQAMSLAYDTEWRIERLANGRAISAQGPIPPGIFGYDPEFRNPYKQHDLEQARRLMVEAGYRGGRGPDGRPMKVYYDIGAAGPEAIQPAQAFAADMAQIGIEVEIRTNTWSEFLRKLDEGSMQVFGLGWVLDYPDPENFLQLLYGPNRAPGPNNTMYDNPRYNELYERMKSMEDTPERLALIEDMVDIVVEDAVWIPSTHPESWSLRHQWSRNAKPHGITGGYLKYRDVDVDLRRRLRWQWNRPNYGLLAVVLGSVLALSALFAALARGGGRAG